MFPYDTQNALSDLPFGYNTLITRGSKEGGVFSAVWPEFLHQMQKGLMERAIEMTVQMIIDHGGEEAASRLDTLIKKIEMARQSERLAFPLSTFPNGLTNLTKIMGQEFPAAILQLISILASDKSQNLLPRQKNVEVIAALNCLYALWLLLDKDCHVFKEVGTKYVKHITR